MPKKKVRHSPAYRQSDVEVLLRRGSWRNWDDAIRWLEENGEADGELAPGEALAMRADLMSLRDRGFRFTHKPDELYTMAREHRYRPTHRD
jgi:hypothetical protein